ncbi:MAG: hypothetical protein KC776_20650, partial [Myxococcales bacterium]|nr:hypothetical protein [Myxococcales bacterium]
MRVRNLGWVAVVGVWIVGCTYDFDAFDPSRASPDASAGGAAGSGGGSGAMGGTAGAAGSGGGV